MDRSAAIFWWGADKVPSDVAYYHYDNHPPLIPVMWSEIIDRRRQKQSAILEGKRRPNKEMRCGFIWVFYNDTDFFSGWWIYIKTLKRDFAINFRHEYSNELIAQAMELYPCGVLPIFDLWCDAFTKQFHRPRKRKQEGFAPCRCYIENGRLKNLLI